VTAPIVQPRLHSVGEAHAELLSALHARCFDEVWTTGTMRDLLQSPGAYAMVATVVHDQPAGFVLARAIAGEGEILSLGCLPKHRRCGIARWLMSAALGIAGDRQAKAMFLEVAERNIVAQALYVSMGFAIVGRRQNYYPGQNGREAALVMKRALTV
jgi:ribosomal-protein-alanine N-acetyltransferase